MNHDQYLKNISVEPANPSDLPAILNLLEQSHLPQAGIGDHLATAVVARAGHEVIGCAALEMYGPAALLRSVAVAPAYRGQGLGQRVTEAALRLAQYQGVSQLYLLTETAGDFFPKFGFRPVDRSQVSPAVRNSVEFTSLCPDSALAMELHLERR
jgi:amino-acid N-acetyltransferase